ncbi:MAG TPA: hypothetical protein EYN67_01325 [Flavobacteriales bacterium]|nr:hypothetical protein [Flavobacteriales bacterium]HIO15301.1 hypothetical protein [Flavobacteriales bacterium]
MKKALIILLVSMFIIAPKLLKSQVCSEILLSEVLLSDSTIEVMINNLSYDQLNYPFVELVTDANGDTIQMGNMNLFVQFGGTIQSYYYPLLQSNFVEPLTIYFSYWLKGDFVVCELEYGTVSIGYDSHMQNIIREPELVRVVDLLGREVEFSSVSSRLMQPLIYIYDDGSRVKKIAACK